jgi:hypothetical protein
MYNKNSWTWEQNNGKVSLIKPNLKINVGDRILKCHPFFKSFTYVIQPGANLNIPMMWLCKCS